MNRKTFLKKMAFASIGISFSLGLEALKPASPITLKQVMDIIYKTYVVKDPKKDSPLFDAKDFGWDKSLSKELGFDSLDTVEFIMNLEKQFNISIKDEHAEKVKTPRDAAKLVYQYLKNKP